MGWLIVKEVVMVLFWLVRTGVLSNAFWIEW